MSSAAQTGANDAAWEVLFERHEILQHIARDGRYVISADDIRKEREPRLMAKFDHRVNLPAIFKTHRLAIVPVTRGSYVIAPYEVYERFPPDEAGAPTRLALPSHLQSLRPDKIISETMAVNCALNAGMLADFLQEEGLCATVSGRMGSEDFTYRIRNALTNGYDTVAVQGAQIEIDAAFEGAASLALLEAKRDVAEDFLVRQLYYPFRRWHSKVAKPVRLVYLVYTNGIFHLYEYAFLEPDNYSSLQLVRQKRYTLEDTRITRSDLRNVARRCPVEEEPPIPFPQANNFRRVINLCELLAQGELSREQITQQYAFDVRQTNYYTDAARYLGLVEKSGGKSVSYRLSADGCAIMDMGYRQRQLALCARILRHRVFAQLFAENLARGAPLDQESIVAVMRSNALYHVGSENTRRRRASTVYSWLNWMLQLAGNG